MAGARKAEPAAAQIEDAVGHRRKNIILGIRDDAFIDPPQDLLGRQVAAGLGPQHGTHHGHDQRAGNALARNVGNGQPPMMLVNFEKVVEIAADDQRGFAHRVYFVAGKIGKNLGEQHFLELVGDGQFLFQALLLGQHVVKLDQIDRDGGLVGKGLEQRHVARIENRLAQFVDHHEHTQHAAAHPAKGTG